MITLFSLPLSFCRCLAVISALSTNFPFSACHPSLNPYYPGGSNNTLASPTPSSNSSSTDFRDPCARLPLTPQLWQDLKLDEYLQNFPGGQGLSLEDYVEKIGETNFQCGIGKLCNAGQICTPIPGRDWYILVAIQNWNSFSNEMYQATAYALNVVQGLSTSIVNDIAPHEPDKMMVKFTFLGVLAGLFGAIPGFLYPQGMAFFGNKIWPFIQGGTGFLCGIAWTYHNIYAHLPSDEFSKTMDVNYLLSKAQAETQAKLSTATRQVIDAGISTNEGIYGVLKDGVFLNNHFSSSQRSEQELEMAIAAVARGRLIAAIWKALKYFVIRGNTSCTADGPNGALPGNDVLSYCGSDGMMMNIVQSKKGQLLDRFPAAHLLPVKYNLTTEYFVTHSYDCQQKFGSYNYDPYKGTVLPADPNAECIVSLAVCDMTREDIRETAKKKGMLKACREVGKVPGI